MDAQERDRLERALAQRQETLKHAERMRDERNHPMPDIEAHSKRGIEQIERKLGRR